MRFTLGARRENNGVMRKMNWILAALALLSGAICAGAAGPNARYTVDVLRAGIGQGGLPENVVTTVTQTRDGYLWVGTLDGLARYDGTQFDVFDEANTPGLNSVVMGYLFEDSASNLWIGTAMAGVALVKNGTVQTIPLGAGSREGKLVSACEDNNGTVWLYTADGELARRRKGAKEIDVWREVPGAYWSRYRAVVAEKSGAVWVATDPGMWRVDTSTSVGRTNLPDGKEFLRAPGGLDYVLPSGKGGYWRLAGGVIEKWNSDRVEGNPLPYPWNRASASGSVSSACEDAEGNLVVGTLGEGIWWFDSKGGVAHISNTNGLSHNTILSLCMDGEGNLWAGTDGRGLDRVRRSYFDVLEGSGGKTVQSVSEGSAGDLWIGFNGGGVAHWKDGTQQNYGDAPYAYVRTVFVDKEQQVWAGTVQQWRPWGPGLFKFQDNGFLPAGLEGQHVSVIFQDRRGTIWAGTDAGLFQMQAGQWQAMMGGGSVQAIAEDADGILWAGTIGGLFRYENGKFALTADPKASRSGEISALYADKDRALWIGTRGRGLERLQRGKWTHYTTDDGLISDSIGYIIEDNETNLWMGSPAGFMRIAKKALNDFARAPANTLVCRVYGEADGLPTGECTFGSQPAACRTRDGTLLLPTINGLVSVDPAHLGGNTNLPPVHIQAVSVDGRLQVTNSIRPRLPTEIVVPPGKERLDIQFASPDLASGSRVRFKYRLEEPGRESGWTEVDSRTRTAYYNKLQPGDYTFHVIAGNEDGVWNETGASLRIIVQPPFWRTWTFIVVATICVAGIIAGSVHYFSTLRFKRQLALEKERRRIARDIHDQVGASLTQVSMLGEMVESDKDEPAEVEEHGKQIAQTARETAKALDEIVWAVNPSNDTLDGLITYFCKYAQEYLSVAGLRYRLDVPPQLPATPISPDVRHNVFLAAKEAVTNIVRHAEATAAWIRLRLEADTFVLEIEDNGKGMAGMDPKHAQTRNGLNNMRKRLEESGGRCVFSSGAEGGTLVRLTVPMGKL